LVSFETDGVLVLSKQFQRTKRYATVHKNAHLSVVYYIPLFYFSDGQSIISGYNMFYRLKRHLPECQFDPTYVIEIKTRSAPVPLHNGDTLNV